MARLSLISALCLSIIFLATAPAKAALFETTSAGNWKVQYAVTNHTQAPVTVLFYVWTEGTYHPTDPEGPVNPSQWYSSEYNFSDGSQIDVFHHFTWGGQPPNDGGAWLTFPAGQTVLFMDVETAFAPEVTNFRSMLIVSYDDNAAVTIATAVPEPSTWTLLLVGIGIFGILLNRRGRKAALSVA